MDKSPQVGILMGSANDYEIMVEAARTLKEFGIPMEMTVSSAHRSPERTSRYAREAASRGLRLLIVGAGAAAHLAGVVAAETILPVVAVPIDSSALKGLDALLSTVQMPAGIPVATMAIGKAGARNAGILAAQILALGDPSLADRVRRFKADLSREIENKAIAVEERLRHDLG
ncbi:MAG: 5-(carboxyamino)imidazole ribonucleotide mutase [Desulfuromonadaceae bacterium]|nr:5-(carboxyamino)imidazole ribonucleotide mutase [Desulfuromonadaceae bacterium]